jgi:hypothetical protein
MEYKAKVFILGLALVFALATGAQAQTQQLAWDGTHWKEFPLEVKVAYVKGIGNMASFETSVGSTSRAACISKAFVDELKNKTLGQVVAEVDKFYQDNPAKLKTPVIEVILAQCTKICAPAPASPEVKK